MARTFLHTPISHNIKSTCFILSRLPVCQRETETQDFWGCPVMSGFEILTVDPLGPVYGGMGPPWIRRIPASLQILSHIGVWGFWRLDQCHGLFSHSLCHSWAVYVVWQGNVVPLLFVFWSTMVSGWFVCQVVIHDSPIEQVSSYKYLGVHLDDTFSWYVHVKSLCSRLQQRLYFLRRLRAYGGTKASCFYFTRQY